MKHLRNFMVLLVMAACVCSAAAQNKFVGVKTCAPCHKTEKQGKQLDIWQKSKHAEAYKALLTPKAAEIANAKGLKKAPSESPECLSCHVSGYDGDAKLVEKTFDMKDGVQCETCHGAGSGYKTMTIMKDKAKSIAAGMREFKDKAAVEAFCKTCHNEKSPTYKEFVFAERWPKIEHPVPAAKK
jgi:hypothetical protein